jgi:hypothetical protein
MSLQRCSAVLDNLSFWRWTSLLGILGLVPPIIIVCHFLIFKTNLETLAHWLWPTSFVFMSMDTPDPSPLVVVAVYAIAFAGNVFLYAVLGVVTWPLVATLRQGLTKGASQ